jgi:DNA-binding LacI/PurR family transcriptional regulator
MAPVYREIMGFIQDEIKSGRWKPGNQIPSESQLMQEFSTSRITVTRALQELESRGIIYRIKGKGSFVAEVKQKKHSIISLIIPHKANFLYGGEQYTRSICNFSQEKGYFCSVHYSEQSSRKEREILEHLQEQNIAGIILYPINSNNVDIISSMLINHRPMVLLDRQLDEIECSSVESDNLNGTYEIVQYLIEMGHRSIAYIGANDSHSSRERYRGYCHALFNNGIPVTQNLVIDHYNELFDHEKQEILDPSETDRILLNILEANKKLSAIFCINDQIALHVMAAAERQGIQIPEDLSIAGFDNLPFIQTLSKRLTTVEQDFNAIGKHCVNLLTNQIEGKSQRPENIIVKTQLIVRSSVANLQSKLTPPNQ